MERLEMAEQTPFTDEFRKRLELVKIKSCSRLKTATLFPRTNGVVGLMPSRSNRTM